MRPRQSTDEILFLPMYGTEKQDDNKSWIKKQKKEEIE